MSGVEHVPTSEAEFTRRSNRVIERLWTEICWAHQRYETLVAVLSPAEGTGHFTEIDIYAVEADHPVRVLLRGLPRPVVEVVDAPHSPRVVKLLYLESNGKMRFLTRPISNLG